MILRFSILLNLRQPTILLPTWLGVKLGQVNAVIGSFDLFLSSTTL